MGKAQRLAKAATKKTDHLAGFSKPFEKVISWGLPILVFLTYVLTLCPSLSGGDSGELITVAHTLGVAHPPGYPLYTLLAKAFTWIPHGSIAWRVNLLSAFCDSLASVFLLQAVFKWTRNIWAGAITAGLFAFSPLIWTYAVTAEVFALNNLFVSILFFMAVSTQGSQLTLRRLTLTSFVFGLGLSNHHTLLFCGSSILLWMVFQMPKQTLSIKLVGLVGGTFVLGFLPYAYLPWASHGQSLVIWGDSGTWNGFWAHFLRKDYGTFQLSVDGAPTELSTGLWAWGKDTFRQASYFGLPLAAYGLQDKIRKEGWLGLAGLSLLSFLFYLLVFHSLANMPLSDPIYFSAFTRFWQQADIFVFIWAGLGFSALTFTLSNEQNTRFFALISGMTVLLILVPASLRYRQQDQRGNFTFDRLGHFILDPLPQNAAVFTLGDIDTNSARYLQSCEGVRPDVALMDRAMMNYEWQTKRLSQHFPRLSIPGRHLSYPGEATPGFSLGDLFLANTAQMPVFISPQHANEDRRWKADFYSFTYGMTDRILPKNSKIDPQLYFLESGQLHPQKTRLSSAAGVESIWERYIGDRYTDIDHRRAVSLFEYAMSIPTEVHSLKFASQLLKTTILTETNPDPVYFHNLGLFYSHWLLREPSSAPEIRTSWKEVTSKAPSDADLNFPKLQ